MPRWPEDKTAADVLADVGRILYGSDDWQARLARDLKVGRHTIQQWRSGKLPLDPDHGALDDAGRAAGVAAAEPGVGRKRGYKGYATLGGSEACR